MKRQSNKRKKQKGKGFISVEEWLGNEYVDFSYLDHPADKPVFINDGSGNGWFLYNDGVMHYCYFR